MEDEESVTTFDVSVQYAPFLQQPHIHVCAHSDIVSQCDDTLSLVAHNRVTLAFIRTEQDTIHTFCLHTAPEDGGAVTAEARDVVCDIATSHRSGLLRLWRVIRPPGGDTVSVTQQLSWRHLHRTPVTSLAFDRSGAVLGSGSACGHVRLWSIQWRHGATLSVHCTHSFRQCVGVVNCLVFGYALPTLSRDSVAARMHVLAAGDDPVIHCWRLQTSAHVHALRGHFSKVTDLRLLHTDHNTEHTLAVSCSRDHVIILWDWLACKLLRTIVTDDVLETLTIHRWRDNRLTLLAGGASGRLLAWQGTPTTLFTSQSDADNQHQVIYETGGSQIHEIRLSESREQMTAAEAESDCWCYLVTQDGDIHTTRLDEAQQSQQPSGCAVLFGRMTHVVCALLCECQSGSSAVSDTSRLQCIAVACAGSSRIRFIPVAAAVSPCDTHEGFRRELAAGWMSESRQTRNKDDIVSLATFGYIKGAHCLIISGCLDGEIDVWAVDISRRRSICLAAFIGHTAPIISLVGIRASLLVYSVAEDRCLKAWQCKTDWLKRASTNSMCEISRGSICNVACEANVNHVTCSTSTSRHLAATDESGGGSRKRAHMLLSLACQDKVCRLYRLEATRSATCEREPCALLRGHTRAVSRSSFSPTLCALATCSLDGTVRVWSLQCRVSAGFSCEAVCLRTITLESDTPQQTPGGVAAGTRGCVVATCATFLSPCSASSGGRAAQRLLTTDSEGHLRVWTLHNGACVARYREHADDHMQAVTHTVCCGEERGDGGQQTHTLLTHGTHSHLLVWTESTERTLRCARERREQAVMSRQQLQNLLHEGARWGEALKMALRMDMPDTCYRCLQQTTRANSSHDPLLEMIGAIFRRDDGCGVDATVPAGDTTLTRAEFRRLLAYACEWNTNTRRCVQAQRVLHACLRVLHPHQWPRVVGGEGAGGAETHASHRRTVEALFAYTERHVQRMRRCRESLALLSVMTERLNWLPRAAATVAVRQPTTNEADICADQQPVAMTTVCVNGEPNGNNHVECDSVAMETIVKQHPNNENNHVECDSVAMETIVKQHANYENNHVEYHSVDAMEMLVDQETELFNQEIEQMLSVSDIHNQKSKKRIICEKNVEDASKKIKLKIRRKKQLVNGVI